MVGFADTVWLYHRNAAWQGEKKEKVSLFVSKGEEATLRRNQSRSSRVELGLERQNRVCIRVRKNGEQETAALPGDIVCWGEADFPEKLEQPSEPQQKGWNYCVLRQVNDYSRGPLPYWEWQGV